LSYFDSNVSFRRKQEAEFDKHCPKEWRLGYRDAPWVYDLRIPGFTHNKQGTIVRALQARGCQARHAFKPMSSQEEFKSCLLFREPYSHVYGIHSAAEVAREVIYLPLDGRAYLDAGGIFDTIRSCL
jgi:dTDP-4-amino-4,6-dideoxygalactose transaminase